MGGRARRGCLRDSRGSLGEAENRPPRCPGWRGGLPLQGASDRTLDGAPDSGRTAVNRPAGAGARDGGASLGRPGGSLAEVASEAQTGGPLGPAGTEATCLPAPPSSRLPSSRERSDAVECYSQGLGSRDAHPERASMQWEHRIRWERAACRWQPPPAGAPPHGASGHAQQQTGAAPRQWPEVYDLCHTFLHVARVKKPTAISAMRESRAILAWP